MITVKILILNLLYLIIINFTNNEFTFKIDNYSSNIKNTNKYLIKFILLKKVDSEIFQEIINNKDIDIDILETLKDFFKYIDIYKDTIYSNEISFCGNRWSNDILDGNIFYLNTDTIIKSILLKRNLNLNIPILNNNVILEDYISFFNIEFYDN